MTFQESVKTCFTSKFATFDGRASRSEFWWFYLLNLIVSCIFTYVIHSNGLGGLWSLITLVPGLAVSARRLHDINKSGWWYLIALTIVGVFVLLYWWAQKGDLCSNQYGEVPADVDDINNNSTDNLGGDSLNV